MAQVTTNDQRPRAASQSNTGVGLNNSTFTTLIELLIPDEARRIGVQVAPTVRDFTAFLVEAKFHPTASFQTITSAVTATPPLPVVAANATLATLTATSIGWFLMDVSGICAVRVSAKCATDATGLCDAFAVVNV